MLFGAIITSFLRWSSYRQIARIVKWLTFVLLAYFGIAFLAHVHCKAALLVTVVPHFVWSREYLALFLGTWARLFLLTRFLAGLT